MEDYYEFFDCVDDGALMYPTEEKYGYTLEPFKNECFAKENNLVFLGSMFVMLKNGKRCNEYIVWCDYPDRTKKYLEDELNNNRYVAFEVVRGKTENKKQGVVIGVYDTKTDTMVARINGYNYCVKNNIAVLHSDRAVLHIPTKKVLFRLPVDSKISMESKDTVVICDNAEDYNFMVVVNKESGDFYYIKNEQTLF